MSNAPKPYLKAGVTWGKLTVANPTRGFTDDDAGDTRLTAIQKAASLSQMLGLISQWVPHYLASDITKNSISLDSIWQAIRKYYGLQQSETQFMKFTSITWEDGERPERLYQRILARLQDNLLRKDSKLKHDGVTPTHDEDISPTVERLAVLRWMELIHPSLPVLVQRTFAFDLQRMTLKDIQPQIVDALDGFLEEIRSDEVKSARVYVPSQGRPRSRNPQRYQRQHVPKADIKRPKPVITKECRICKGEGRSYVGHTISDCDYVSRAEKHNLLRSFRVDTDSHPPDHDGDITEEFDDLQLDDDE